MNFDIEHSELVKDTEKIMIHDYKTMYEI